MSEAANTFSDQPDYLTRPEPQQPTDLVIAACGDSQLDLTSLTPKQQLRVSRITATVLAMHANTAIDQRADNESDAPLARVPIFENDCLQEYYAKIMPGLSSHDPVWRRRALKLHGVLMTAAAKHSENYPEISAAEDVEAQFADRDLIQASESTSALIATYGQRLLISERFMQQRFSERQRVGQRSYKFRRDF